MPTLRSSAQVLFWRIARMPRLLLRQSLLVALGALIVSACTGAESRKASFVAQGEKNMAAHEWQKARLDFRSALQIDPKDQAVQLLAARAAERAGDYDEAAGRYRALLEQDKASVPARTALGRLYAGGGLAAEAIKLAEEGLATHPDDAGLLTVRGVARAMRGDLTGAQQDAEAAIARAPSSADAATLLASLYQRKGRTAESIDLLERAASASPDDVELRAIVAQALAGVNRHDDAERHLLEIVKIEPRVLKHRYRLAQFYMLQKQTDAAEKALRAAVEAAPGSVEAKLALANLIAAQRSFEAGEKGLKEIIASDPKNLDLQLGLGQFYEAHQRPAQADAVYAEVAKIGGTSAQGLTARNRRAGLALRSNRSADASRLIEEVLGASPRDNEALTMRADIALARGDTTSAIADLRAVLRDQPNAPALMRALAAAYAGNNDVALAEETLRSSIRVNPIDIPSRLALADLLMRSGRGEEAQPVADQLVAELPGDVRALEAAFRVQVARRDLVGARTSAAQIQRMRPDLPTGLYLEGLVNEVEGSRVAALRAFERATALAPGALEPVAAAVRVDLALGQPERGLARVNDALQRSATDARLLALKGEMLAQLKRYDEAESALRSSVAAAPAWWMPYRDLAALEMTRGRMDAAISVYVRGIDATQHAPPLVTQLGSLYERHGRIDEAISLYDAWLEREPDSEVATNNLAMLLVSYRTKEPGAMARAVGLSERLRKSTQPQYLDTYGWVQYLGGKAEGAVEVLMRAVAAAPEDAQIRAHLGLAQLRAGKRAEAISNLRKAAADLGELPEAPLVRAALQSLDPAEAK